MSRVTWHQVKWAIKGQQYGSRLPDKVERDKFVDMLPSVGAEYIGEDLLYADSADDVITNIKKELLGNENGGKVIDLKVVK